MKPSKLFCYGILKKGFGASLDQFKGTNFLGEAFLQGAQLHSIHTGVGLRFSGDPLEVAQGEVWEIPPDMWEWLDRIENNGRVYTRKIVTAVVEDSRDGLQEHEAWVYEHVLFGPQAEYDLKWPKIESGCFGG